MPNQLRSVGFQLRTDGKAEVKNDFAEVAAAGNASMDSVAAGAEASADRVGKAIDAITDRQIAAWKKDAAAAKLALANADARGSFDAALADKGNAGSTSTVNLDRSTGAARDSAAVFAAAADEEDRLTAAATKLRAAIDPLSVVQAKFDAELADARTLISQNAISLDEYSKRAWQLQQGLEAAKKTTDQHSSSLGFNRTQLLLAEGAAHRLYDSLAAGMSPMRALTMQSGDLGAILSMDDGGVSGGLAKVKALITPLSIALVAETAIVVAGAAAWLSYVDATQKLQQVAAGAGAVIGATGHGLEEQAEQAASIGKISVSSARDIETAYVKMGGIGNDVLTDLTALTGKFAIATGQDAKGAQEELGKALQQPIDGAQELAAKYGLLTQSQIDNITQLVAQGDLYRAQKQLLDDVAPRITHAAEATSGWAKAWQDVSTWASNAWTNIGKALENDLGTTAQKITELQHQRALLVSMQAADPAGSKTLIAELDQKIDLLKKLADATPAKNSAQQKGQSQLQTFQGDTRDSLKAQVGTYDTAIQAGGSTDSVRQLTAARDADQRAIDSWIPVQQKATELAAADAKIAAARTPLQKQAAASEKELIELKGVAITKADAEARVRDAGTKALENGSKAGENHAKTLARDAESMDVSAEAAIGVANAYLKSTAAGVEADAQRKAATDATKKGIDVQAQARRQLALDDANQLVASTKSIAGMKDETQARATVIAKVLAGTVAAKDINEELQIEAALRPLLAARTRAHGAAVKAFDDAIAALPGTIRKSNAAIASFDSQGAIDKMKVAAADARAMIPHAAANDNDREAAEARVQAERAATDAKLEGLEREQYISTFLDKALATRQLNDANFSAQKIRSQQQSLELTNAEIGLIGSTAAQHDRVIARLQIQQELAAKYGDDASKWPAYAQAELAARLKMSDAIVAATQKQKLMDAAMGEARSFADDFAEKVLSPDTWSSWGNAGKTILKEIEDEFIKLALLNPLKNMIDGGSSATLGSVFGSIGKLLGGVSSLTTPTLDESAFSSLNSSTHASLVSAGWSTPTHNATGTQRFSGGLTYVNENGGEIEDLPDGTRIYPAGESRRMMAQAANDSSRVHVTVGFDSEMFSATVAHIADSRVATAAPGTAMAGAQLAEQRATKRARFRIPGR